MYISVTDRRHTSLPFVLFSKNEIKINCLNNNVSKFDDILFFFNYKLKKSSFILLLILFIVFNARRSSGNIIK